MTGNSAGTQRIDPELLVLAVTVIQTVLSWAFASKPVYRNQPNKNERRQKQWQPIWESD